MAEGASAMPDYFWAQWMTSRVLRSLGNHEAASHFARQAVALAPRNLDARVAEVRALLAGRDFKGAYPAFMDTKCFV